MLRSSATVRRREKLTDLRNSLTIGLQRGVNSISAVHPVTWVRCLFDWFSILDFGGKWPLKWKFSKMSFQIPRQDRKVRFVTKFGENRPLRSCRKVAWLTTQKKLCGTCLSPNFAQNGPIVPKISWTLSSLDMSTYTKFGPDQLHFAVLFRKDWFFGLKNHYNIGFQSTINNSNNNNRIYLLWDNF